MAPSTRNNFSKYRPRDQAVVQRFGLRNIRPRSLQGQQSPENRRAFRSRQRAGRQAWRTRVNKYGRRGRKVDQRSRLHPVVVINVQQGTMNNQDLTPEDSQDDQQDGTELSGYGNPQEQVHDVNEDRSPTQEGFEAMQDGTESAVAQVIQDEPRSPLVEIPLPVVQPTRTPGPVATSETAYDEVQEMARLLDERRNRLLGPQHLTQQSRRARPSGTEFMIHEDQTAGPASDANGNKDDKENARPAWSGSEAPAAPGARPVPRTGADAAEPEHEREEEPEEGPEAELGDGQEIEPRQHSSLSE